MKNFSLFLILTVMFGLAASELSAQTFLEAEDAIIGPRAEAVSQEGFRTGRGVARMDSLPTGEVSLPETASSSPAADSSAADSLSPPDLVFQAEVDTPGRYRLQSFATVDSAGRKKMAAAKNKKESLFLLISVDGSIPSPRVVVSPWKNLDYSKETLGHFTFASKTAEIRIWLPASVRLDVLRLDFAKPVPVPEAATRYQPSLVPPPTHPRLWVTLENRDAVRRNLTRGENAAVWEKVKKNAASEYRFEFDPTKTVDHNARLLATVRNRAFVYLMEGDETVGRSAAELTIAYLSRVEYGNIHDITRQIGESIYTGSLVFDWCHALLSEEDRSLLATHLFRLAREMEIGWPPFGQPIVNGHGNEAQINRDLLAMSIALYERDPLPYQYCAYRVLEELVPMRAFEYQSPRHNQGISYCAFRLQWELQAAILFKRMTGREVFHPNIKTLRNYFLYTQLPDGSLLRDGDGIGRKDDSKFSPVLLTLAAYGEDPLMKGDFLRRGPIIADPVLFLLINDPDLTADFSPETLPKIWDTGPILSSQIIRTGWDFGPESDDMVIEFKGGCYYFVNHQHPDSGAFQIWYRGWLAADLGQYHFYGTPYDMNFTKRSVSHSMPLVYDPNEEIIDQLAPDGGQRFVRRVPTTPDEVKNDPLYRTGTLLESTVVPSKESPDYSVFSVDLTPAWSEKVSEHRRSFCWIRTGRPENPAVVVIFDKITSSSEAFRKFWQVNSLTPPTPLPNGGFEIMTLPRPAVETGNTPNETRAADKSFRPRGKLTVRPLVPGPEELNVEFLGGVQAHTVFGRNYTPPDPTPEADGWRALCSPKRVAMTDRFLFLLNIGDEKAEPLPFHFEETDGGWRIDIAEKSVSVTPDGTIRVTAGVPDESR